MRRVILVVGMLVIVLGAFVVATQLLRQAPAPVPIIPSASPTPATIQTIDDLYQTETELGNLDVDAADQPYQTAIQGVR